MERTLLISQSYEPIAAISWQRAVVMIVLDKVEILEEYKNTTIRSVSVEMNCPAVIRLVKSFRRPKRKMKFSKQHVFARDKWCCQYCGKKKSVSELTYDHVTPKSRGGTTCFNNIVTACSSCNSKKGNKTPKESGMFPKNKPHRPNWVPSFSMSITNTAMPEEWKPYCWFK